MSCAPGDLRSFALIVESKKVPFSAFLISSNWMYLCSLQCLVPFVISSWLMWDVF